MTTEDKVLQITGLYADFYAGKITLGELHDWVVAIIDGVKNEQVV